MAFHFRRSNHRVRGSRRRLGGEQLEHRNLLTGAAMEELTLSDDAVQTSQSRADDAYIVKLDAETTTENTDGGRTGDTLVHEVGHWLG